MIGFQKRWGLWRLARRVRNTLSPRPAKLPERHVIVFPQQSIAYIRVPKAANTSIRTALAAAFDLVEEGSLIPSKDRFWADLDQERAHSLTLEAFDALRQVQPVWCFSFVRHPVSRLYSCWNNKVVENTELSTAFQRMGVRRGMGFDEFADIVAETPDDFCDLHVQSQASMLTYKGQLLPDFIGKVETISEDWESLCQQVAERSGVRLGRLPQKNMRSKAQPKIAQAVSQRTLEQIKKRYATDFQLFYPGE